LPHSRFFRPNTFVNRLIRFDKARLILAKYRALAELYSVVECVSVYEYESTSKTISCIHCVGNVGKFAGERSDHLGLVVQWRKRNLPNEWFCPRRRSCSGYLQFYKLHRQFERIGRALGGYRWWPICPLWTKYQYTLFIYLEWFNRNSMGSIRRKYLQLVLQIHLFFMSLVRHRKIPTTRAKPSFTMENTLLKVPSRCR